MKVRRTWVTMRVGILVLLAACGPRQTKPEEATKTGAAVEVAAGGGPSAVHFAPAGEGLPGARIWKSQLAFGDINGDGFDDLAAVSRLADGPWAFVSDGKGNWTAAANDLPREPFCGGGVDFADVNKDGKLDLGVADHCKGVFVFLGDGAGNWKMASSGLPSIGAEDISLGDFNNDGCADLASVAAAEEGVRAFRGDCKGGWTESSTGLSTNEWGNAVELADVNGDGKLDIAAAYSGGPRVWLGDGTGSWQEASAGLPAPEIHGLYWGLAVGDLNGDGKLDLVSGSQMPPQPEGCGSPGAPVCVGGGVEAYLQQADGSWQFANSGFLPMNTLGVAIGDLDNDGKADIVAVGKRHLNEIGGVYGVFPYFGDGKGGWRLGNASGLPESGRERTWGVALGDMNGDRVLDVAVAFGDVVAPQWRSSGKGGAPQRGKFGSIEVWKGQIGG